MVERYVVFRAKRWLQNKYLLNDFELALVLKETQKAFLLVIHGRRTAWLPKSQLEIFLVTENEVEANMKLNYLIHQEQVNKLAKVFEF